MAPRTVTIADVARLAGVSAQTVSNVLNRPERVRPATADKVRRAVDQLGYRAHAAARRLRTRRSDTIALRLAPLPGGVSGTIMDVFLHEITAGADERGLRVLLYVANDPLEEIARLEELLAAGDVDGVVLDSTRAGDPRPAWLAAHDVPCVTFGRPWGAESTATHPWVDVDGATGTAAATEHLIAGGARQIAFLGWPDSAGQGASRLAGWRDTVLAHHLVTPEQADQLAVAVVDTVEAAVHATTALLAAHPGIDGIVCASDSLAFGAYLVVGADVPVIGFDNTPVARAVGLSSLDQRVDRVAREVLDLLTDADGIVTRRHAEHRLVTPELRLRKAVVQDPDARLA